MYTLIAGVLVFALGMYRLRKPPLVIKDASATTQWAVATYNKWNAKLFVAFGALWTLIGLLELLE